MRLAAALFVAALVSAPAGASTSLTIGVSAPLSGPDAVFGDQLELGVDQAVADLNAEGGFLGEAGRVVLGDDANDPKVGLQVAKRFATQHIPVVVGPFSSAVAVPSSAVYAEAGMLDLVPAATAPLLTERGLATVFRLAPREDSQAATAARYMDRRFARIAVVHDRGSADKALADHLRNRLASAGGARDVFDGSVDKGARDLSGLVARLKAAGAQAVFWAGSAVQGGLLARQLKEAEVRTVVIGGFALGSDEFAAAAGPGADGSLVVFPRDPRTQPSAAALLRRLEAKGQNPGAYAFSAYAAIQLVAQAAKAAGSLDPAKLAQVLHSGRRFKTVLGDMAFDAKGDLVAPDLAVYVWHRGAGGRMAFDEEAAS